MIRFLLETRRPAMAAMPATTARKCFALVSLPLRWARSQPSEPDAGGISDGGSPAAGLSFSEAETPAISFVDSSGVKIVRDRVHSALHPRHQDARAATARNRTAPRGCHSSGAAPREVAGQRPSSQLGKEQLMAIDLRSREDRGLPFRRDPQSTKPGELSSRRIFFRVHQHDAV